MARFTSPGIDKVLPYLSGKDHQLPPPSPEACCEKTSFSSFLPFKYECEISCLACWTVPLSLVFIACSFFYWLSLSVPMDNTNVTLKYLEGDLGEGAALFEATNISRRNPLVSDESYAFEANFRRLRLQIKNFPKSLNKTTSSTFSCTSNACKKVAKHIFLTMNFTANPCKNPMHFYCGKWSSSFSLPPAARQWGLGLDVLRNRSHTMVRNILESVNCSEMLKDLALRGNRSEYSEWAAMATCHYESCKDTDALDAKKSAPLFDILFTSTSPLFPDNATLDFLVVAPLDKENATLTTQEAKRAVLSHRLHGIVVKLSLTFFYNIHVGLNTLDPSKNQTFRISDHGLGLRYPFYDPKNTYRQERYKEHLENLLSLFDSELQLYNPSLAKRGKENNPRRSNLSYKERSERIYNFEVTLREIMVSPAERRDVIRYTNGITYGKVKMTSTMIDMEAIFSLLFEEIPEAMRPVKDDVEFLIHDENYLEKLSQILKEVDWTTLHDYLLVHILRYSAGMLSQEWRNERNRYRKAVTGAKSVSSFGKCRNVTPTWILAKRYIEKAFDPRRKRIAQELIEDMKSTFRNQFYRYDWMDNVTRAFALKKLDAMKSKVAFPDWLLNEYEVHFESLYGPKSVGLEIVLKDFFAAQKYMHSRERRYLNSKFGKPLNKNDWSMLPYAVNAYYTRAQNEVAFMAAILENPVIHVWNEESPSPVSSDQKENENFRAEKAVMIAMTYGGAGGIIGHEMTHGFDDKGRIYDEEGRLNNWWSKTSEARYREKAKCIGEQYSSYSVNLTLPKSESNGQHTVELFLSGNMTLGENIADNGGLIMAWNALKTKLSPEELNARPFLKLEPYVVNLTIAEMFMLQWAQLWCRKTRPRYLHAKIETSAHPPSQFRIIGSLANFSPFAETYNCPKTSLMHPENRCRIW